MAVAYVNGTDRSNQGVTNGSNQTVAAWTNNLVTGNAVALAVFFKGTGTITGATDSAGNNLNQDCGLGGVSRLGDGTLMVRGAPNIVGGTTPTMTIQFSAAQTSVDAYFLQYSGVHLTSMWDVASSGTASSGTVVTSTALTPTVTDGAGLAFCVTNDTNGSAGSIAGSAATLRIAPAGWGEVVEDRIFTSSIGSSVTASANMSSSISLGAIIFVILKAAAGASSSPLPARRLGGISGVGIKGPGQVFREAKGFAYSANRRIFLPSRLATS